MIRQVDSDDVRRVSLCLLGGLQWTAWRFYFPTEIEKLIWHVPSLVLAGSPLVAIAVAGLTYTSKSLGWYQGSVKQGIKVVLFYAFPFSVVSRALLVALMLASLRALPCSVHQTVPWRIYILHL